MCLDERVRFDELAQSVRRVGSCERQRIVYGDRTESVPIVEVIAGGVGHPGKSRDIGRTAYKVLHGFTVRIDLARGLGEQVLDVAPGEIGIRFQQQRDGSAGVGSGGRGAVEGADEVAVRVVDRIGRDAAVGEYVVAPLLPYLIGGDDGRVGAAELTGRRAYPEVGAGGGIARLAPLIVETADVDEIGEVRRSTAVGAAAPDPVVGGPAHGSAGVEVVAGGFHVDCTAAAAEVVHAVPEQGHVVSIHAELAGERAETHIENVHTRRVGVGLATAERVGVEVGIASPRQNHGKNVVATQNGIGGDTPSPGAVVGCGRDDSPNGRAVIAEWRRQERLAQRRFVPNLGVEVVGNVGLDVRGQVRMAQFHAGVCHGYANVIAGRSSCR